ncbi:high nitrogen upregulated cytochrome P450 monooxygenase 2 [Dichomitus squalens]|uniref:High nitrogen upregulated cytochrome P450 monooxygenase 2 n=1 Tax=Dichomitus squalens TaxID=114155 RepID=A0A4Q9MEX5_9APHY|nr:high nitrogen upregulated cytochrome P450 monooxygenase 2 [Dichomitus squalens]
MCFFEVIPVCACAALVAHQVFRRHETYSIAFHWALLLGLPVALGLVLWILYSPTEMSTPRAAVLLYGFYLGVLGGSIVSYRLGPFHPLANFKGPLAYRITKLSMAVWAATGSECFVVKALHDKYGDVVRTGPNELSVRDPSLIPAVMGASGLPKGPNYLGMTLTHDGLPMVGIQDTEEHLRRRRPWTRGLNSTALKEYEPLMAERVAELVASLITLQDKVILLDQQFAQFSHKFMSDMAFGDKSKIMHGDQKKFWSLLDDGVVFAAFFSHVPWLGFYVMLLPMVAAPLQAFLSRCREFAIRRIKQGSTNRDLFYYLNNEDQLHSPPPPLHQLVDDGVLAIVAGSDTTSTALTSLFYCLLTHPKAYAAVVTEVDNCFSEGETTLTTACHGKLPYLDAAINESLRLFPPAPNGSLRQVPRNGKGVHVGSIFIPPGTAVCCHLYSMHLDARNFSFPDTFWPERWLLASGRINSATPPRDLSPDAHQGSPLDASSLKHNDMAFMPFSYGPMNCVGKNLALAEIRMVACALIRQFEFRLQDGWEAGEYRKGFRDYGIATRPKLPVLITRRSS